MGLIRSVLRKASPKRFKGVVKESKSWHFVCKTCGYKKSVYDSGGIRYKAKPNKVALGRCPVCKKFRWFKIIKKNKKQIF
ncbi:hypothetical protein FJZ53_04775 [Candidatus Woesearchaeota archaeon]|nr:hypothetical protein [Candidatus Woesearchaeota archaeon]